MSTKTKKLLAVCTVSALAVTAGAISGVASQEPAGAESAPSAVYRLLFNNDADLGENAAGGTLPSATVVNGGGVTVTKNAWKGNPSLDINGSGHLANYVQVPIDVMNGESATVAGWFKLSTDMPGWSRLLEVHDGIGDSGSWMSAMPFAPNYYNGLHVNMRVDGDQKYGAGNADNFLFEGKDTTYADYYNTPVSAILPIYDAWVHYAYEFTPTGFSIYQNGELLVTKPGDFSAKKFYGENGKFVLGATDKWNDADFIGSFSDFRVYDAALTGDQIKSEFDIKYTDLLTASYDFENGGVESVRGYDATLVGNAVIEDVDGHGSALVIDGTPGSEELKNRSSAKLPAKILSGHNKLSVSLDAYVDSGTGAYSRLLEFAEWRNQYIVLGIKWGGSQACLRFTDEENVRNQNLMFDVPYDRWFNIQFTLDGNTAAVYIDGKRTAYSDAFNYDNKIYWDFGGDIQHSLGATSYYGENPIVGKIDNVKIYQTALTEKQVMKEFGLITIENDEQAVASESEKFVLEYDGGSKLTVPDYAGEGVRMSWVSDDPDVIANDGTVLPVSVNTDVNITITFVRGDATVSKTYKITVKAAELPDLSIFSMNDYGTVKFDNDSHYADLMKVNLDYMMGLDKDRLLYNYRRIAGLDTLGAASYGAWISPTGGGAGQFEAHYITALAKATRTMPDYKFKGESVLDRLTYMITELKKCQDAYAAKHPEDAGYLGAISAKQYDALVTGASSVTDDDGTKCNVWVPWYFFHKQIEAMLDVQWYAPDEQLRNTARGMLSSAADWAYNKMSPLTDSERAKVLRIEYGGMAEALYQTYTVTGKVAHFNAAKFFEEKSLLDNVYANKDVLTGLHSNTAIPKFLGCAAAYEITGDEYYKTICVNAFEMIMTRTYAFGGTSIAEHWRDPGVTEENLESAETCCSYNMLKLADYLFRWTGEKKYADYYENVYTNHILASMDPDTGGKTYLTNTAFGYYKIYHTADNSFWCCACSGMENFAQLPQGIYYADRDGGVRVNMFYPSEYSAAEGFTIKQSGNFYTDQKTTFTIDGSGSRKIALRVPDWASETTVKINGVIDNTPATGGYIELTREWADGDVIEYSVPFSFRLDKLKGSTRSYAVMYGPLLLVADLGTDGVFDIQGSQLAFGTQYTGKIVNKIALDGDLSDCAAVNIADGTIEVTVSTLNQGDLIFCPFNRVFHSRYGMYFEFYDKDEDLDADYTVSGNETGCEFDSIGNLDMFAEFGSTGGGRMFGVGSGWLLSPASGENKLMAGLSLSGSYAIDIKLAPYTLNEGMNGGVYIMASGVGKPQDMITAYNIQVERDTKAPTFRLNAFKFGGAFLGSVKSVTLPFPDDGIIDLHILVKDGKVAVFVNGSRNAALTFDVDTSFITETAGDVGIRAQACRMKYDGFRVVSSELHVGTDVLRSAIAVAEKIDTDKYVAAEIARLESAIAVAKTTLADGSATQAKINAANSALRNALAELNRKGDRALLDIAYAAALKLDARNYTSASFDAVKAILGEIHNADLDDMSQTALDALSDRLTNAVMALVAMPADSSALKAAVTAAESLKASDYTTESYAALKTAIEKAKALGDNASASDVDGALIDLLDAETKLVVKSVGSNGASTDSDDGNNGLAIAAIVLSSVMLAAVIAFTAVLVIKRKKRDGDKKDDKQL